MIEDKVHVITVSDENYSQHLGVMLVSLFENTNMKENITIHIIDVDMSNDSKFKLVETINGYGANSNFITIEKNIYENFGVRNYISRAAYYKLSISEVLHSIDKVLFLDCDLIIKRDIWDLWNIDISNYILAAVEEPHFDRYDELNIPFGAKYFNSGVMLMNLKLWREKRISEKAISFLKKNSYSITLHDQDALNAVLYNEMWLQLPLNWNVTSIIYYSNKMAKYYDESEYNSAIKYPSIIHFTGPSKPWYYLCDHPFAYEYNNYLQKSKWNDFEPKEKALLYNRKVIIFGTGEASVQLKKIIDPLPIEIYYYVDNDSSKWGKKLDSKEIYPPHKMLYENKNDIYIIVASMYYKEIRSQLKSLGFHEFEHFIWSKGRI